MFKKLCLVFLLSLPLTAAISSNAVWDIRQAGSNNNGCFFVTGASGTNYSTGGATTHATITTLSVVNATTTKLTVSLTDYTVSLQDIGNGFHNTGGTATQGWFEITGADTVANTWTLDRSLGTAAQTATGKMGGSCGLPNLSGVVTASNKIYVKCDATYTTGSTLAFSLASGVLVQGYQTTQGDRGCSPTIQATAGSFTLWNVAAGTGSVIDLFSLDCNLQTACVGMTSTSAGSMVENGSLANCKSTCFSLSAGANCQHITVNGQSAGASVSFNGNQSCYDVKVLTPLSTTGAAFLATGNDIVCLLCIGVGHASATTSDVFSLQTASISLINSICYNAGRDCVRTTCTTACPQITNSIFYTAVGWCVNMTTEGGLTEENYNAMGNCNTGGGTGTRNNVTAGANDVTLTANPFTSAPTDFTLNATSGGGLGLKTTGYPGNSGVGTGYRSIGPLQPLGSVQVVF
jgi:hypothetical protein